jgi:uncharacterized protein
MRYSGTTRAIAVTALSLLGLAGQCARAGDADLEAWRAADAATVRAILALARQAFDAYTLRREVIDPPAALPELLHRRAAVFVSAMRNGAPRCCMGTLYAAEPDAAHEIVAAAVAAAGRDRRFPAIKPAELKGLTLIVSVVGSVRPMPASDVHALDPAVDGLAVRYGDRFGVVLSRETARVERMAPWARTRAGARAGRRVDYFRLRDVRFVEGGHR